MCRCRLCSFCREVVSFVCVMLFLGRVGVRGASERRRAGRADALEYELVPARKLYIFIFLTWTDGCIKMHTRGEY